MAARQENTAKEQANVVARFIKSSYQTGMKASEDISLTAWDIPANILEGMGVDPGKTGALKDANRKVIGGVYGGVDKMARKGTSIALAPWKGVGYAISKLRGNQAAAKPEAAKKAEADVAVKPEAAKKVEAKVAAKPKAKKATAPKQAAAPRKARAASKAKSVDKKAAKEAAA
mgnify:FL=1